MITVAFTVSTRRPRYLRRTLESWAQVRGLDRVRLVFFLEPPIRVFDVGAFTQWARTLPAAEVHVERSNWQLGCNANTRRAMSAALRLDDFAVLAEEDTVVADDIVEYYEWAACEYRTLPVLAVCAHVKAAGAGTSADVFLAPWFSPLGWGTWADRWENVISPGWEKYGSGWDGHVRDVRHEAGLDCAYPALSRTRHFGDRSTLTPPQAGGRPSYICQTAVSQCYQQHYGPQVYREVPVTGAVLY